MSRLDAAERALLTNGGNGITVVPTSNAAGAALARRGLFEVARVTPAGRITWYRITPRGRVVALAILRAQMERLCRRR